MRWQCIGQGVIYLIRHIRDIAY